MSEYLFSYGTLQKVNVQLELFGRSLKSSKDTLRGYRVSPIVIKDEIFLSKTSQANQLIAIISNNKNDAIEGSVLEVSREELLLSDKYEPEDYQRIQVELESGKKAWIYAAKV